MGEVIQLFGVKELDEFFKKMERTDQRKIMMEGFKMSSKPLINVSRMLLRSKMKNRSKTKNLEKSIGFVSLKANKRSVYVSAKVGARRWPYKGFHGHLYDAGTVERQTKDGKRRGRMPASHFFTEAVEQTQEQMVSDIQTNMMQALEKTIEYNLKKMNK